MNIKLHHYSPRGVLLKVEWGAHRVGYSDLYPYPEFGDARLDQLLENLRHGRVGRLLGRSLYFNRVDAEARHRGLNLFSGLLTPRNHRLWRPGHAGEGSWTDPNWIKECLGQGFDHFKLKVDREFLGEREEFFTLVRSLAPRVRWRLDFNFSLLANEFVVWLASVPMDVWAQVDFIEDPVRGLASGGGLGSNRLSKVAWDWTPWTPAEVREAILVIKPTHHDPDVLDRFAGAGRVIFTHSLSHPVAQVQALWEASCYYRRHPQMQEVCGLWPSARAEWHEFSAHQMTRGSRALGAKGTGFGFDELLSALKWESL